jgi:hypothetical protein
MIFPPAKAIPNRSARMNFIIVAVETGEPICYVDLKPRGDEPWHPKSV